MADEPAKAGRVLAGRYRLEERLGSGGMGTIWRAEDLNLSAPVAVKLLDPDVAESEETAARFKREAKAAAALRSTYVVQILDYGVEDEQPFIVMELLEGETLRQRLKRTGPLDPGEMARIVAHVSRAISRAHDAGIVHRDLKPDNIFLVSEQDEEVAKVLDFGVAKVEASSLGQDGTMTRTGSLLGTPFYMSPEQAQGNKEVDHRSDLWSLAVIAFECLTNKRPFTSDALGDLVIQVCIRPIPVPSEHATVPAGFDEWFARATQRKPAERFQSAREMVDALRECLGDEYRLTVTTARESSEGEEAEAKPAAGEPEVDEDTFFPAKADQAAEPAEAATPAQEPEAQTAGESPEARRADGDAALQETVLAAPAEGESGAQPQPAAAERQGRGLVYLVAMAALVLGGAAGIWGVLSMSGLGERSLPDPGLIPLVEDQPDADADGQVAGGRGRGASAGDSADADAGEEPDADLDQDAGAADAESDAQLADVQVEVPQPTDAAVSSDAKEPPIVWDYRPKPTEPRPPKEDEEGSEAYPP